MSIAVGPTWSIITSVNSVRTILLPLELLEQIESCLQLHFFEIESTSAGNNINEG